MKKNNLEIDLIKKLLSLILGKLQVSFSENEIENLSVHFSDTVEKTLKEIEKDEGNIYFEHNSDAVKSSQSVGINTFYYDNDKKDLTALKQFLDENL